MDHGSPSIIPFWEILDPPLLRSKDSAGKIGDLKDVSPHP